MNKFILSGLLLAVTFVVIASISNKTKDINPILDTNEGIQFIHGDWKNALAEAKSQHKLIFLDAYASWCGPCKMLKKNTFPNKEAGEFFNKNFINIAVDMEKGEGPFLSNKFSVSAYPTLIIADADGNIITYAKGYMTPKQLLEFGNFGLAKVK